MNQNSKKKIELRYQFINGPDLQERLDDIFNFIFEETVKQMKLDNSKGLSYTYKDLENKGVKNGRK